MKLPTYSSSLMVYIIGYFELLTSSFAAIYFIGFGTFLFYSDKQKAKMGLELKENSYETIGLFIILAVFIFCLCTAYAWFTKEFLIDGVKKSNVKKLKQWVNIMCFIFLMYILSLSIQFGISQFTSHKAFIQIPTALYIVPAICRIISLLIVKHHIQCVKEFNEHFGLLG